MALTPHSVSVMTAPARSRRALAFVHLQLLGRISCQAFDLEKENRGFSVAHNVNSGEVDRLRIGVALVFSWNYHVMVMARK